MNFNLTKTKIDKTEFYGISCDNSNGKPSFDSLSTDRKSVSELCKLMNKGGVTELTAQDIVEDFINNQ